MGLALMARMGWQQGTGLGREGRGQVRAFSVRKRVDGLGLGAGNAQKESEQVWKAATDVFNGVLGKLKPIGDGIVIEESMKREIVEDGESAAIAVKRLSARAGLYSRFMHAKDVSRYSSEDLSAILGRKNKDVDQKEDDDERIVESQEDVFRKMQGYGVSGRGGLGFGYNSNLAESEVSSYSSEQSEFTMSSTKLLKLAGFKKESESDNESVKKEKKRKKKSEDEDSTEKEKKKKSKKDRSEKKKEKKEKKSSSEKKKDKKSKKEKH
jgi:hypothetical protein